MGKNTCSFAFRPRPPPGEAAAVEPLPEAKAPPSPPLFPIRVRSSRRWVAVSRLPPLVVLHPREEQPPAGCCFPAASLVLHRLLQFSLEQDTSRLLQSFPRARQSRLLQSSLDQIK